MRMPDISLMVQNMQHNTEQELLTLVTVTIRLHSTLSPAYYNILLKINIPG
jgi:hypothetical protein